MDAQGELAEAFEAERGRLTAIAVRVLGVRTDAEDVVQEAWLRLIRQESGSIENLAAWLTTVVGRLCVDTLRTRTAKAEAPLSITLDESEANEDHALGDGPEQAAVQADQVGLALLVLLGALEPDERMAFVLHDLFAVPFAEIGSILGKSTDAAKMSASRARRKVRGHDLQVASAEERRQQRAVVDAFLAATRDGDFAALLDILHPDLVWEIHSARAVRTQVGAQHLLEAIARGDRTRFSARRVLVDGQPGIVAYGPTGKPVSVMSCTVEDGRMTKVASFLDRRWLDAQELPPAP
ncbi:sigma-70 family RNA polymerase sigma factor [Nocardioides dubius]|uniref:Sigma-70 family RNA polymerase sigma factor n=1 Tax=Nocardioides dubius TaxID=317019 RepID=A0ABN1TP19_9ACTN